MGDGMPLLVAVSPSCDRGQTKSIRVLGRQRSLAVIAVYTNKSWRVVGFIGDVLVLFYLSSAPPYLNLAIRSIKQKKENIILSFPSSRN
jgi:hypothetical protein